MLSLSVVTVIAYISAMMLKSEPIYESLLARILKGRKQEPEESGQEKVLDYYAVAEDAFVSGRTVREIPWPEFCLLVSIRKGKTRIQTGDVIITMTDEEHNGAVCDQMKQLCRNE